MTITTTKDLALQDIADLLVSAFEGGSNYWYMIEGKITPKKFDFVMDGKLINGKHYIADYALSTGGAILISDMEGDEGTKTLNLDSIERGMQLMAEKEPSHFADFINEDFDATTADVFLQLCLFGEVIYG